MTPEELARHLAALDWLDRTERAKETWLPVYLELHERYCQCIECLPPEPTE